MPLAARPKKTNRLFHEEKDGRFYDCAVYLGILTT